MTDDGFMFIGSTKREGAFITVNASNSRLSLSAHEAINLARWVTVERNKNMMVKITPCEQGHPHAAAVDAAHQMAKVSAFVRNQKCRFGRYPAEVRDGSLYFQLEPAE